ASKPSPVTSKPASLPRPAKPSDAVPPVNPKLAAAQEAVAQARSLWNTGSREAALEAMRQAVAVAERSQTSTPDPAALPAFQTLVRELARMELALGQVSQLLDQLVRFEPLLADQADLWAVRGNAAQRLGQHQESVHAYGMALKLRPGEPRWMLASAVSLALQGQLAAAAEQAEKARAAGPVSPEVLTYLRQLGVSLR
ncbi:MAG: tetratricopeptide repeat protein, partial [Pseudomonadota bacterium]|nr:tetratricopeptide repeat protein [Pseudomonadota bacterium]